MTTPGRARSANASASAMKVASAALRPASQTLLRDHCTNMVQGSSSQPPMSGRSMKSTGRTNPNRMGRPQATTASTARPPRRRTGCASALPARWPRSEAKRMRCWARRSSQSSRATVASSTVASCAAARRLSMESQAL